MALGAAFFSFSILACIIFHQEILELFDGNIKIKIGEHEFLADKNEHIMTASINLGCYFLIEENGSLKRIKKEFFESDENVTQEYFLKTPVNSDVNKSFFNVAIQNLLMQTGNSVIFDFEFKAFEVNSVSRENEFFFPCCLDPASIDLNTAVISHKEENCVGDQLIVYMSIKTTPLIWKMLEDPVFIDAHVNEYTHVMNIYEDIHDFKKRDYEVYAKNCPDSFLLCNSSFVTQLMEMSNSIAHF